MERLRQSLPTCSPAACCEAEALDDPLDGGVVSELNYGNWMSDVANRLWNIPLRRIHLPGAHNSAAFKLHHYALAPAGGAHPDWVGWLNSQSPTMTTPISQLAVPWADCQGESVLDQLRHGVRYLDLRAVWVEGGAERRELGLGEGEADWLVTHTLLGGAIEEVFIQVAAFLREHPREVVLLDLQHVKAAPKAEAHAKLLGQIEKHLAPDGRMAPPDLGVNVTYGELVQAGYQCLVFYPFDTADADFPGVGIGEFAQRIGCWHRGGGILRSPWPQVGTLEGLLRKLGPLCEEAGHATGFFVLQGVVTPDAAMVAAGLLGLPNRPRCLRELAEVVTPHVQAFCSAHPGRAPCIVMVDFVSQTTIVPSLLSGYYKSMSLPRALTPPTVRSTWRLPADRALLEARGLNYWDNPAGGGPLAPLKVLDLRQGESQPREGGGGGGSSATQAEGASREAASSVAASAAQQSAQQLPVVSEAEEPLESPKSHPIKEEEEAEDVPVEGPFPVVSGPPPKAPQAEYPPVAAPPQPGDAPSEVGTLGTEVAREMRGGALPGFGRAQAFAEAAREAQHRGVPGAVLLRGVPLAAVPLGKEDTPERLRFYDLEQADVGDGSSHASESQSGDEAPEPSAGQTPPPALRIPQTPTLEAAELFVPGSDEPGTKGSIGAADHRLEQAVEKLRSPGSSSMPPQPGTPPSSLSPAAKQARYAEKVLEKSSDVNVTLWLAASGDAAEGVPLIKARARARAAPGGNPQEKLLSAVRAAMRETLSKSGKGAVDAVQQIFTASGLQIFSADMLEANGQYIVCGRGQAPDFGRLPSKLRLALKKAQDRVSLSWGSGSAVSV